MPITDARQKLNKSSLQDARARLNSIQARSKVIAGFNKSRGLDARSRINHTKGLGKVVPKRLGDARLKIAAKKSQPGRSLSSKPSIKKLQMIVTQEITPTVSGTTRTIRNPGAIAKSEKVPDFRKMKPTGFVSVSDGSVSLIQYHIFSSIYQSCSCTVYVLFMSFFILCCFFCKQVSIILY